jgi:hypothetical protein
MLCIKCGEYNKHGIKMKCMRRGLALNVYFGLCFFCLDRALDKIFNTVFRLGLGILGIHRYKEGKS